MIDIVEVEITYDSMMSYKRNKSLIDDLAQMHL